MFISRQQTDGGSNAYTGYFETDNASLGENGMFMNTKYDTLENLNTHFPGRALQHFKVYSKILTKVLQEPEISSTVNTTHICIWEDSYFVFY